MSSAIISVGRLAAEIRLQQCIDQFQSSLSKEQQAAFLAARDLAIKATPELRDVMNITAEIDRQGRLRNGVGRRCFGPRMAKILESIQQFVSVGDILIGGSQNLIACGVWSLVRLSLLTASRFSAYLEKVSELFMVVGQSAPRYQSMVALHPRSKQLRQLGIEYQITIVNLCRYIVTTCSKSTVGQLKSMFSDIDMSFHQSELLKWGGAIKDQLNLEEAKGNSKARMQLKEIVARDAVHKNLERKFTLLNACSTFDYQVAWRQTRKCGNATWFIEDESYDRWKRSSASCLLLVSGKLGSGKTVALASILDDVLLNFDSWSAINMFCREDRSESLRSRTVIGCLARQILQTLRPEAINFNESIPRSQVSIETIKDLIGRNVPKSTQLCLIMDGIDECQLDDRSLIIDFLQYLQSCIQLKICLSYRSTADSVIQQELIALGHPITLNMPEENPDIADFIRSKLESCLETGALTLGDPTLVLEIVQTLEMGAKGMFLWAVLQIDTICNQKTDSKIREALHQLPKTLPETFARALSSARKAESEYHERLFNILIAAVQPLSKDEIREALSVRPYEPALDPSHLINDIQAALTTGGSLIVVDEEELTVRFIHPSVKQFLLGDLEIGQKAYIDRANAHLEMAKVCKQGFCQRSPSSVMIAENCEMCGNAEF
ncbi:hypothetical protein F5Y16DRAFT_375777 [Xylariaceae sp. FL0255]|nr:hypothetical protein F5Y16DRAFT_375777 [Xylariaceae sp. FL0255]